MFDTRKRYNSAKVSIEVEVWYGKNTKCI